MDLGMEKRCNLAAVDFPKDSDGDGLTDYEELSGHDEAASTWQGTTTPLAPSYTSSENYPDTDGDGVDDAYEAMAGTNPRSDTDYFHILSIHKSAGGDAVTWSSVAGKQYSLYMSTNMMSNPFLPVLMQTYVATGGTVTATNNSAGKAFYRINLDINP
jgi:hypothetical protein